VDEAELLDGGWREHERIRHTTAVHLLRAGVDINTIRAWLGHVSLDTTNVYAEVDLEMKAKALSMCEIPDLRATRPWHRQVGLMSFLKELQRDTTTLR
jgi:integrase/recombinase XerD